MNLPAQIEIEINSHCNRSCDYCPNSSHERIEQGEMEPELFERIIDELASYHYEGKISYMFYNEPLLSKNFDRFTHYAREKLPAATFVLYSNGSKLTSRERFQEVSKTIDQFIITKHHQEKDYPFENVLKELKAEERVKVNYRTHEELELCNRAGLVKTSNEQTLPLSKPCHVPSLIMTITLKGNVVSCFEDYEQNLTFGNITDSSIHDLWNNQEFSQFRADLVAGKREKYKNCASCNRTDLPDKIRRKKINKHLIDEKEEEAIINTLRSGKLYRYQRQTSQCELFEKTFSEKFGFHGAVLINSGTNALVAALMALEINPGDEVIIPAYTYIATAAAVINCGAIPVIANIDQKLAIDCDKIEKLITPKTKAIIAVHMDGLPSNLEKLKAIKEQHQLYLIEDTAQALGGKYRDQYLGTIGDIGCYSLNRDKNITTGEGGIVATKDPLLYERLLCSTDHGYSFNPLHQDKFHKIKPFLGHSMRVSEITGAMALVQLEKLDQLMQAYRERKDIFKKTLNKDFLIESFDSSGECHTAVHLSLDNPKVAAFLSRKLLGLGIETLPITMRPAHTAWKWGDFLTESASYSNETNPLRELPKSKYHKINFLSSMQILGSTLKIDIDPTMSLDQTNEMAIKLKTYLESFTYRYNSQKHKV